MGHVGFTVETYTAIKKLLSVERELHTVVFCDTFDLFHAGSIEAVKSFATDQNLLIALVIDREDCIQSLQERVLQAESCKWFSEVFIAVTDDDVFDILCAMVPAFVVTDDSSVVQVCNSVYVQTATPKKTPQTSKEYLIHRIKTRGL
jgi:glycerol-3-phosphate cytidylyltransferase-like family protein